MAELPRIETPLYRHTDGRVGWNRGNRFLITTAAGQDRSIDNKYVTDEMLVRAGWIKQVN